MSMIQDSSTPIPIAAPAGGFKPGYLIKIPEYIWERIINEAHTSVELKDHRLSFVLPTGENIPLQANPTGQPTELHLLQNGLTPLASASFRLNAPISTNPPSSSSSLKSSTTVKEQKRISSVASRFAQQSTPLARSLSTPPLSASSANAIPLKTRVVQILALGPASVDEIIGRVGGAEGDVNRVVAVVGRQVSDFPTRYSLLPTQYSKIKIGGWKYSYAEQEQVVKLAKEAFDELGLPDSAEERVELEQKLKDARSGSHNTDTAPLLPIAAPISEPVNPPSAPVTPTPTAKKPKKTLKSKGVVAKEIAKFKKDRPSSVPVSKGTNGLASPRQSPKQALKSPTQPKVTEVPETTVPEPSKPSTGSKRKREKHPSPTFTSSEEEEEERGRGRSPRHESKRLPSFKRKSPPAALDLSHHTPSSASSSKTIDPETMRDRYEELYPAYQQLTGKLVRLHQSAEIVQLGGEIDDLLAKDELSKMVTKWEKWHKELNGIRHWFGESAPAL